jgi:hypothetical protein
MSSIIINYNIEYKVIKSDVSSNIFLCSKVQGRTRNKNEMIGGGRQGEKKIKKEEKIYYFSKFPFSY